MFLLSILYESVSSLIIDQLPSNLYFPFKINILRKKIERGTIERLRAFQNPPPMVGMTMVMLMILIGRPEFASYVVPSQSKVDRKHEAHSNSDEASRISSGTTRKKKDQPHKPVFHNMGKLFNVHLILHRIICSLLIFNLNLNDEFCSGTKQTSSLPSVFM